jgi:hypothetical protein
MNINRPLLEIQFTTFQLQVETTPTPIKANGALTDYIESFVVSVDSGAANDVYFGNINVQAAVGGGMQIVRGAPLQFFVQQVRQLYELQSPLEQIVKAAPVCVPGFQSEAIPFVCWNLANVFLIATAVTQVSITTFRTPFV